MQRLCMVALLVLLPLRAWAASDVANTVHNLSVSGPGPFKSLTIDEVCVFCHTPHSATPSSPLWNHELSGATYIEYGSSTLFSSPGQPTGKSRLCLSCHDGTVALGALGNPPAGAVNDLTSTFLTGRASLGTDLADDHPVSFPYDTALQTANGQLADPTTTGLPLENQDLQCSSCHDPHEKDIVPFLHRTTLNGQLCTSCHQIARGGLTWAASSHATSAAQSSGPTGPWDERKPQWRGLTVAENACFDCHRPHNAVTPERLVKNLEEETCFLCHDGSVAATDIRTEIIAKTYRHPVDVSSGIHDPTEDFVISPPSEHVECADCHAPHLADSTTASAPFVSGPVQGVKGIDSAGAQVADATNLYEICYKCHADNNVLTTPRVTRQIVELNTRLEFDIGGPSQHPVEGAGRNSNVPSLISPLTESSVIYCTDCHNNDTGPGNGGSGPNGPHGSNNESLLERNYTTTDFTPESTVAYAICYKCHDQNSILGDDSFKEHDKHIRGEDAPCSVCHDSHGISAAQGTVINNSHLINFDTTVVTPDGNGIGPRFEDLDPGTGNFTGQCFLTCHGKNHDPFDY